MKYLDHAPHEMERLHPVAFTMVRTAAEAFECEGCTLPEEAMTMISPTVMHRLPELFHAPDEFRPERFEENPKPTKHLAGFGGGLHRCPGAHFAYMEMTVALAYLLRDFDFELIDENPRAAPGAHQMAGKSVPGPLHAEGPSTCVRLILPPTHGRNDGERCIVRHGADEGMRAKGI